MYAYSLMLTLYSARLSICRYYLEFVESFSPWLRDKNVCVKGLGMRLMPCVCVCVCVCVCG